MADVVYYYGDHIPNIFGRKGQDPAGALPDFDYDVLSEELFLTAIAVKDDRLALLSGMRYRVLVLPDHRVLSLGALKKVDALVRAGATVLGPKPLKAVSLEGDLAGTPLALELGDVEDVGMARVRLNGTDLGIVWRPPFRVNLGKSLHPGANTLEIMVVNSWRNLLIGDAALPENQRLTKTNVRVIASGPGK